MTHPASKPLPETIALPDGPAPGARRHIEQSMFPELRAHKAVGPLVPSVITGNNADLVEQIRHLGYFDGSVIDLTYGDNGGWWKRWQPADFTIFDGDFTQPIDGQWDTVCYDPPYIPAGGSTTSTAGDFQDRYGIRGGRNQDQLDALMRAGLENAARAARRYLLVKCMDYVNGGKYTPQSYRMARWADELGLFMHDEIVHNAGSGPGGHNIVNQLRARRSHSKLLVYTWKRVYS